MQSSTQEILPIIGTEMGGGFYAGRIRVGDQVYALIVAPKAEGERAAVAWNKSSAHVAGARSYCDGFANSEAMSAAGSKLAAWARELRIAGNADWYIPSQDELEVIYRNLKPTASENYGYARSGINVSAVPPTYPYTPESPGQTPAEAFQSGAEQAFEEAWYWSSTQHASTSEYAGLQSFLSGTQYDYTKSYEGRARAVRRLPI